jgi:4-amino-4-deoxy-L-arabinose transferase-like glycosyltransferase
MDQRSLMLHHLISRPLWVILLLALFLRAAVIVRSPGRFDDPDNYLPMARALWAGEGFALRGRPTAYRPPLYPLLLAPLAAAGDAWLPWGIAALHLALGAGAVGLTAVAAERLGLSRTRAMIAASIVACDPVLVVQSRSVMTETPTAFLVAATLAGLARGGLRGAVLGGLGLGLASLCRPSMLAGAGLTVLAGIAAHPGDPRQRLGRSAAIALTVGLVLLPWMLRNRALFGEPVWTTTHGGYTLALANNPVYYRDVLHGEPGRIWTGHEQWLWWDSINTETKGMSEPQANRYLTAKVWRLARRNPGDFARATLARLGHFWSIAPAASVYPAPIRWATTAWTLPLWIVLGLGLLQRSLWRWPQIVAPMLVLGLTLVHALYWTDLRMRAPIVPAIALIAAGAGCSRRVGQAAKRRRPTDTRP